MHYMTGATLERNLSDFLRKSGDVLEEIDQHDVLLRRRDGHDVLLVRADREQTIRQTVELSLAMLARMARDHGGELTEVLTEGLPWIALLPAEDRREFSEEFINVARACASLGTFDRLGVLLAQWRNTAQVWSRPELLEALQREAADDFSEPVPTPTT